jgi:hypothetical protein
MNQLRIGDVKTVAGVRLIPVETITIYSDIDSTANWWYGTKELYALVIMTSFGLQAFDKDAHEMNISELISNVPKLEKLLNP